VQTGTSYTLVGSDNDTLISMENAAGGTVVLPAGASGGTSSPLTFVQAANCGGTAGSGAPTATATLTPTAGNTLVLMVAGGALDATSVLPITSVTDTKGNMWTKLKDIVFFAVGMTQQWAGSLWVSTGVAAGSTVISAVGTSFGTTSFIIGNVLEYTPSVIFTFDTLITQQGTGADAWSATTPALSTSGNVDLLLEWVINQTTNTDWAPLTYGAGYTQRIERWSSLDDLAYAVADKKTSAIGGYTASVTTTHGTSGIIVLFAVKLVAPSTFIPPAGFYCWIQNTSTGTFTVKSATNIDGSIQNVTLGPSQGSLFVFDGANWWTERGIGNIHIFYQTVQQAGVDLPQEKKLNFLAPFTATDNPGNNSTDIGLSSTAASVVEINGVIVSLDKKFYLNGVTDGAAVWGVSINGTPDGG
jgi:hypothetical protein